MKFSNNVFNDVTVLIFINYVVFDEYGLFKSNNLQYVILLYYKLSPKASLQQETTKGSFECN